MSIEMHKVRILYFFHHPDCVHCKKAMPILDQWKSEHKERLGYTVMIIKLDLSRIDWVKNGFSPRMTPAYQLEVNGQGVVNYEGMLGSQKNIDKFVKAGEQ